MKTDLAVPVATSALSVGVLGIALAPVPYSPGACGFIAAIALLGGLVIELFLVQTGIMSDVDIEAPPARRQAWLIALLCVVVLLVLVAAARLAWRS